MKISISKHIAPCGGRPINSNATRQYPCTRLSLSFYETLCLTEHLKTHTEVRPHSCTAPLQWNFWWIDSCDVQILRFLLGMNGFPRKKGDSDPEKGIFLFARFTFSVCKRFLLQPPLHFYNVFSPWWLDLYTSLRDNFVRLVITFKERKSNFKTQF